MRTRGLLGVVVAMAAACGGGGSGPGDDGTGDDGGDDSSGDDAAPDASTPDAPPANLVRFIAMGDAGKGNTTQREVAVAIRDLCAARGCDFVLLLGDNIYDAGVESVTDPQWQTKFEEPYHDLDLPFYVALGNHDYGGTLLFIDAPGIGNEWEVGRNEVMYSDVSTKWNMPNSHYTFSWGHVGFIVLDTNSILWNDTTWGDQASWLPTAISEVSGKDWVFVAGHHPYRSNGTHGNAGAYDAPEIGGIELPNPLPIQNGAAMKDFFDAHVCGLGQVYFSGHDHSRQWLDEADRLCGTQMIVSGAGASVTDIEDRGNDSFYEDADEAGFMYVVVDGDTFTGQFYDKDGNMDFERSFTRP